MENAADDLYADLAYHYHWTPEQIDRMDPDRLEAITARLYASIEKQRADEARARARSQLLGRRR